MLKYRTEKMQEAINTVNTITKDTEEIRINKQMNNSVLKLVILWKESIVD